MSDRIWIHRVSPSGRWGHIHESTHANMHVCRCAAGGEGLSTTRGQEKGTAAVSQEVIIEHKSKMSLRKGRAEFLFETKEEDWTNRERREPVRYMQSDWKRWCGWHLFLGETVRSQKWVLVLRRRGKDSLDSNAYCMRVLRRSRIDRMCM